MTVFFDTESWRRGPHVSMSSFVCLSSSTEQFLVHDCPLICPSCGGVSVLPGGSSWFSVTCPSSLIHSLSLQVHISSKVFFLFPSLCSHCAFALHCPSPHYFKMESPPLQKGPHLQDRKSQCICLSAALLRRHWNRLFLCVALPPD